ncbi:MAG: esterase-like activity of phytase family protein [Pseudomonadota bacterium]
MPTERRLSAAAAGPVRSPRKALLSAALLSTALASTALAASLPNARPADIDMPEDISLDLIGALELRGGPRGFGGLSAIEASSDGIRFLAISDQGFSLSGRLRRRADGGLRDIVDVALGPLMRNGAPSSWTYADAEGLAAYDPDLRGPVAVSFERSHRIGVFAAPDADEARLGERSPTSEASDGDGPWHVNVGLEALALLPDGRLLAIRDAEGYAAPAYLVTPDGAAARIDFPKLGPYTPAGADMAPDGRLYVVARRFTTLGGFAAAVWSYAVDGDRIHDPKVLAEFPASTRIDNAEGLAAWQDALGRTRLLIVTDDNRNLLQRTLLLDFVVSR